jgi:outer membrane receptor protein involved in Fe transport
VQYRLAFVKRALLTGFLLAGAVSALAQTAPPAFKVEVIETTPLPGVDVPLEAIAAPVQTALERDVLASGALDFSDFLNRRLTAVFVNEIQGNPFQSDISYRGYTASPLLGTPQGLSVYMDGVRLNQPFGDIVSWDLIPRAAIKSTTLMPGSNPLFGLNTLGGALSVQTKDGRSSPGTSAQLLGGEYGRRAVEFEHGGSSGRVSWFVTGNLFHDSGWRVASPSDVRQIFGKAGWQDAKTDVSATAAFADNTLNGNGLQEQRLLASDYTSAYTTPDITNNRSTFLNMTVRRSLTSRIALSSNAYFRNVRTSTLNGDLNEDSLDQSVYQPSAADRAALAAAGYSGFPVAGATSSNTPFPFWRCLAQALQGDEPAKKCTGLLNRTSTAQNNYGAAGQLNVRQGVGGTSHQFTAGAAYDRSTVAFAQTTQLGYLNADRGVTPINAFADGVTGGSVDGVPYDNRVSLDGTVQTSSVFASDTLSAGIWHVSLAGRLNRTSVDNRDRITPAGAGSLTGEHVFARFNPAAGVTVSPSRRVNLYVGYSEGSRAPTSIELGCADPVSPCKLPNALTGDPPLDQVVTRTWEGGVRGGRDALNWSAGVFRGTNDRDILFVASTQTGFGYFKNFGETRRQGVELAVNGHARIVSLGSGYSFIDATYQSEDIVDGSSNSSNASASAGAPGLAGTIHVRPGDRMPLIPRHTLKAFASVQATPRLAVDVDLVAASGVIARGNEDNAHQPDGTYYLGPGSSPAYAIVNAGARYGLTRWLQLVAQVNNVFDRRYYSAAQLGPTGLTAVGAFVARPLPSIDGEFPIVHSTFYAPGAPTTFWFGARFNIK